jgi:antitoxin PrlF
MDATVVMGQQGRLVIPAEVREALELAPGDQLALRVEDRRLVLERPADAAARLRGLARQAATGRSLVDELLAERRAEAVTS